MAELHQIESSAEGSRMPPVLRQAFRPFFLLGALFGLLAIGWWAHAFLRPGPLQPLGGGLWWHTHEMLFGFAAAIIAGFLLTAVQNWTNLPGVRGWPLLGLVLLWLAGRVLVFRPVGPLWLAGAVDLAFLPAVTAVLARPILRVRQVRNLVFVPILLAFTTANALMHAALWTGEPAWTRRGSSAALFLVVLLITVVGGRVIPFFTARGTQTPAITPNPTIERLAVGATIAVVLVAAADLWRLLGGIPAAAAAGLAAAAHAARLVRWRPASTLRVPLLWSLHLSYVFLPAGFAVAAAFALGADRLYSPMLHLFTVGALGGLILAMIARVSLGHSGRPLVPARGMVAAFAALAVAALLRAVLPAFGVLDARLVYMASAAAWMVGYGLYLVYYARILTTSRPDGRMG